MSTEALPSPRDVTEPSGGPSAATDAAARTARVKPKLRGVSHEVAAYVALAAGSALCALAPTSRAFWASLVYALSVAGLLATSALYHRPTWSPVARQRMRRLDHSAIFFLIAGTYTPVCLLALPPELGERLLTFMWLGAAAGVLQSLLWPGAPKPLKAAAYVALGWAVAAKWSLIGAALGPTAMALLVAGGVLYTVGALIYALRRPDPWPAVFGYHELFHALVVAAAALHFVVVATLVLR